MYPLQKAIFVGLPLLVFCFLNTGLALAEIKKDRTFTLASPDFNHQSEIPRLYTCDGDNISPELHWSGLPPSTKSLTLIVDDPDAPDPAKPKIIWAHWLLYNISPHNTELSRGITADNLPVGTLQGKNDWKKIGYRGPCPPIGKHRYFFKLYTLDIELPNLQSPNKAQLENAIAGHVIGQTALIGTFKRH